MTQEKQNSVRILQPKTKKSQTHIFKYALLGFIGGVISTCLVIFTYGFFNNSSIEYIENTESESVTTSEETKPQDPDHPNHDEDNYGPQVSEKELSGLFKHQKTEQKPQAVSQQSSSPFANFFGQEKKAVAHQEKPTAKTAPTTPVVLKKPATDKAVTSTKAQEETTKPTPAENTDKSKEDISPQASVQISVTQKPKDE
ncbi:hypothetical protein [Acinetobacter stercoris]|uniref:Uncharacterized protein n=1 Tax=Acinetobacter stercoris TaxID=2126983 RepID=A0A2U3N2W5_9GAMM|nr:MULTISPECIES: hypothetical protein [Acinetobacter]SPL71973.1 hypothetical protein KPC_3151 [Acinetobacter stercoris]